MALLMYLKNNIYPNDKIYFDPPLNSLSKLTFFSLWI